MKEPVSSPPRGVLTIAASAARVPAPRFAWKTRVMLPAALLAAFTLMLGYTVRGALLPAVEVRVVPVVVQATRGAPAGGAVVAQATGWVEPDPYPVLVTSLEDGVVREVLVLEGQRVEAGQPVALLVDENAKLAVAAAEADLARAAAEREAAQLRWDNPIQREEAVGVATARARELEAELAALGPAIEAEKAREQELAELFAQVERSYNSGAATDTEFVIARQRLASQRAAVAAAQARGPVLEAQLARARAELSAAQENARLRIEEQAALAVAAAGVQAAQTRLAEAQLRLDRMTVRAPAAGVVMTRHVEAGSKLMLAMDEPLSSTVVRLYDPTKLQVRVDVPLADAAKVGVGMAAEVIVSVLPDRVFEGRVTRVVNEADVARNTLQVKVAIEDPDPNLKPEMLARVRFLAPADGPAGGEAGAANGIFAPESLLARADGDAASVLVLDLQSRTAALRQVVCGDERRDGWVEIASGLAAGDRLIAAPAGVQHGDRVRVVGEASFTEGGA